MAVIGLDPRINPPIGYPHQFANDAIPVANHPMEVAGLALRAVRQQLKPRV
jgi:hypothetical protein